MESNLDLKKLGQESSDLLQRLLDKNRRLEERIKRLDEFSATVAHDIRAHLSGIIMRVDYVLDNESEKLSQETREVLLQARESGQRLTEVVQATYDFARLGREAVVKREVNLKSLLSDVVSDMMLEPSSNIKIFVSDLPKVHGNQGLLRRVFTNLISNSIKYNNKAEIRIEIFAGAESTRAGQKFQEVLIEDNGIGIEADKINRIFSIFWRDPSIISKCEGLGVGLSVVQRIIELHDGDVRVESEPGKFTRFILTLPTSSA